jgi:hypothetical protein
MTSAYQEAFIETKFIQQDARIFNLIMQSDTKLAAIRDEIHMHNLGNVHLLMKEHALILNEIQQIKKDILAKTAIACTMVQAES